MHYSQSMAHCRNTVFGDTRSIWSLFCSKTAAACWSQLQGGVLGLQTGSFRQAAAAVTCSFKATSSINGLVASVRSAARAPPGAGPPAGKFLTWNLIKNLVRQD